MTPEKALEQRLNLTALLDDQIHENTRSQKNLLGVTQGSELHVTNYLFDEKT
jgi:hypothetical protein